MRLLACLLLLGSGGCSPDPLCGACGIDGASGPRDAPTADRALPIDAAATPDLANGDAAMANDLAVPDLAVPDLAVSDLAVSDLAVSDLAGRDLAAPLPNCKDGLRDGAETDVDCGGGMCPRCGPNQACKGN